MATPTSHRCSLLKLPLELRIPIYQIVFFGAQLHINTFPDEIGPGMQLWKSGPGYFVAVNAALAKALVQTCRLIRSEALPILASSTNFWIRKSNFTRRRGAPPPLSPAFRRLLASYLLLHDLISTPFRIAPPGFLGVPFPAILAIKYFHYHLPRWRRRRARRR